MEIDGRSIGPDQPPYIIAEMSANHNGSLERALAIVEAAATAGADAVKLQTYTPDSMTLDLREGEFFISNPNSLWFGQSMHDLYAKACTPMEWHAPIIKRARELGLACFSSPFDDAAVDFLESLEVPAYKIASFECVDLPLIRKAASTGKPLIMSTGMATVQEIEEALDTARSAGCKEIVLLKCTTTYPADPLSSNLCTIPDMQQRFGCPVGLSDHTAGIGVAIAAVVYGAVILEKHFTLSRADGGVDAAFSVEPAELRQLVVETERAAMASGSVHYGPTEDEQYTVKRRRSLYIALDMKAGDIITPENLRRIRPGHGLPPKFYDELLGRRVACDVIRGTPVSWDLIAD